MTAEISVQLTTLPSLMVRLWRLSEEFSNSNSCNVPKTNFFILDHLCLERSPSQLKFRMSNELAVHNLQDSSLHNCGFHQYITEYHSQ